MAEPENNLTIEELAAETGMTVRNIRSHRARGLLPAPEVRDRVGYYGQPHLARLRMIQELPADGFNLKGIERLLGQNVGAAIDGHHFGPALAGHEQRVDLLQEAVDPVRPGEGVEESETGSAGELRHDRKQRNTKCRHVKWGNIT